MFQTASETRLYALYVPGDLDTLVAIQQFFHRKANLDFRERPAEASVRPNAETQIRVGMACDIEFVRLVEHGFVAICGWKPQYQPISAADHFSVPFSFRRRARGEKLLIAGGDTLSPKPDTQLITAVALGHRWFRELTKGSNASLSELAERHGVDRADASRIIRLALLAPDIVEAILKGYQPRDLSLRRLKRLTDLPLIWEEQRRVLGFAS